METYNNTDKFIVNEEHVMECLDTYGVAVIPNVLNQEECNNGYNGMWNYFEHISQKWSTPIQKENQKSYNEFWKLFDFFKIGKTFTILWNLIFLFLLSILHFSLFSLLYSSSNFSLGQKQVNICGNSIGS